MQWTYLPIPKSKSTRLDSRRSKDVAYLSYRRKYAADEMHRFSFYLTRIIFLWMAISIGKSIYSPMSAQGSYGEAFSAEGILLPQTKAHKPFGIRRLMVPILVHKDNRIKIDGELVELEDMVEILYGRRSEMPRMKVKMIVDQRCQMMIIHKVLAHVRAAGIQEVYFTTSNQGGVYL